jgi:hypothetical protein
VSFPSRSSFDWVGSRSEETIEAQCAVLLLTNAYCTTMMSITETLFVEDAHVCFFAPSLHSKDRCQLQL